jgi:hypothetical protein
MTLDYLQSRADFRASKDELLEEDVKDRIGGEISNW